MTNLTSNITNRVLIRRTVIGLVALVGLLLSQQVFAAGSASVRIEQRNIVQLYGRWVLTLPSGIHITSSETKKTFSDSESGTYRIAVRPPEGASTTIRFTKGPMVLKEIKGTTAIFNVEENGSAEISIQFSYEGNIAILSDPAGITFEMKGPSGLRYTGTTPSVFENMPPLHYEVFYGKMRGCSAQRPQKRNMETNDSITFFARLECGLEATTRQQMPTSQIPEPMKSSVSIAQTSNMREVLPGGSARFTINVRNIGTKTLNNLLLTDQFNPESIQIDRLTNGGVINGNFVTWKVPQLFPGETKSITFRVKAKESLEPGDQILIMARIEGNDIDGIDPNNLIAITKVGIAVLPQTGERSDIILVLLSTLGGFFLMTFTIRRKRFVASTV